MSDGQPINVNITVDTTAANAAFSQMAQVLQRSMQQMNQSFTDLQQTMQKSIQQAFQPLSDAMTNQARKTAVMAASVQPMLQALGVLKNKIQETIGASVNWTTEVNAMSNMMGISTKTAGGLTNALTRLGISTDTYKSAVFSLQRAIKGQEEALNANGIATRDASGELLNIQDVMMATIQRLGEMEPGTNRNTLAMIAFGRSAKDVQGLMKLTNDKIREGAERVKQLGIEVDSTRTGAITQYKNAMASLNDTLQAVKIKIGQEVLPILADAAKSFSSLAQTLAGPVSKAIAMVTDAMSNLPVLIGSLAIALRTQLIAAFTYLAKTILPAVTTAIRTFVINVAAMIALADGRDWDEARQAIHCAKDNIETSTQMYLANYMAFQQQAIKEIQENPDLTTPEKVSAVAALADAYTKTVKCCALTAPSISHPAIASEVIQKLAGFVAEHYPDIAATVLVALERFGQELIKEYS